jgi:hypothetical protein
MGRISGEILIKRQVEQVFDYVAGQRNKPAYNPRMSHSEKVTDGGSESVRDFAPPKGPCEFSRRWSPVSGVARSRRSGLRPRTRSRGLGQPLSPGR